MTQSDRDRERIEREAEADGHIQRHTEADRGTQRQRSGRQKTG